MLSKYTFVLSFSVAYLAVFLFGCSSPEQNSLRDAIHTLSNQTLRAEQRIKLVDSLIHYPYRFTIPSEDIYKLYAIKRDALVELNEIQLAVETNDKTIQLAFSLQDTLTIANALVFYYLGDLDKNFFKRYESYLPSILSFTSKIPDQILHGRMMVLQALTLLSSAKYDQAEKKYLMAERIFRRYNSDTDLAMVHLGLGNTIFSTKDREKAGVYYNKALEISRKIENNNLIASSLINLAISKRISNPNEALTLYQEALSLLTTPEQSFLKMKVMYNLSNIYKARKEYNRAEKILNDLLSDCIEQNFTEGVSVVTSGLGILYSEQGHLTKAIAMLETSKQKSDSLQLRDLSIALLPDIIDIYRRTNQYEKALRASQELISQKDSAISSEKQKAILDSESKFLSELKDIENAQLVRVSRLWDVLTWGLCIVLFFIVLLYFYNIRYDAERQKAQLYLVNFYKKQLDKTPPNDTQVTNQALASHLDFVVQTQKPFTNPFLTINDLAELMHVSTDELLREIKSRQFQSYEEFIHFHRIQEARKLIDSMDFETIDDVLHKVGFTSKNYFNLIFEEITGLKSDYYIKNVVKN